MARSRSLAGVLTLVVTVGLVTTGLTSAATSAEGFRAVVPAYAVGASRISGVVVDQAGHRMDDVEVFATSDNGDASQLTYADTDGNGHGFFNLSVFAGEYTVTFSKDGYTTLSVSGVDVGRRKTVDLGTIKLVKKATATETSAKLTDDSIFTTEKGKVKVTVTPGAKKPVGDVLIKDGRKTVGSGELEGSDRGELIVTLDRLDKGTYTLKAVFAGSKSFKESSSGSFTLTVKSKRRR